MPGTTIVICHADSLSTRSLCPVSIARRISLGETSGQTKANLSKDRDAKLPVYGRDAYDSGVAEDDDALSRAGLGPVIPANSLMSKASVRTGTKTDIVPRWTVCLRHF